jgi:hypothetical protein
MSLRSAPPVPNETPLPDALFQATLLRSGIYLTLWPIYGLKRDAVSSSPPGLRFADGGKEMVDDLRRWTRQGEAFWRAHQEAWKLSDLTQRQYCEVEGIPLKAFGNWRVQFKAEP